MVPAKTSVGHEACIAGQYRARDLACAYRSSIGPYGIYMLSDNIITVALSAQSNTFWEWALQRPKMLHHLLTRYGSIRQNARF
jgi:hypothetical protein